MKIVRESFEGRQVVKYNNNGFVVNPLTEQVPYTTAELLKAACVEIARNVDCSKTTKLVTEEDKGAILLAGVSMLTGLPFGMARWYPSGLANQISEPFKMEYAQGTLYLNGVLPGDSVTIIDDAISTGGTMVSLVNAVRRAGAEIVDVICLVEKIGVGGVENVLGKTGVKVKTLMKIDVSGRQSKVVGE